MELKQNFKYEAEDGYVFEYKFEHNHMRVYNRDKGIDVRLPAEEVKGFVFEQAKIKGVDKEDVTGTFANTVIRDLAQLTQDQL